MTDKVKYRKLLRRVKAFLDADFRAQVQMREDIQQVLGKLKKRQHKLQRLVDEEFDAGAQRQLAEELELVKAQRKKGIEVLRSLDRDPS
ncbi:hypothetical protein [Aestuariirhabdus litorea]|uniref:Uncharacterized protein n=1 Tax=Aestuariirhabdus litorea TaxID=2528527 RepID=A0A3P3VIE4_9GAMM|nr:hypothetical protein [Aestuariirhabdus litorea]RRJ82490.1 hypothetical protein D0544_11490 [Aestuariirhabdus litorea]RWW92651.1 hypothetical protein DZC74_11465 [Endozoicomonadaceae bacterium GTF-13]